MALIFKTMVLILLTGAQSTAVEQTDTLVQHVVQPGENLHTITRSYLGTDILWQDNWELNPQIKNPHQLKVGQELTIIKERIIPAEKAKVLNVVNRVEKKPSEGDWLSAVSGDELVQQEGVRTYEKSSALLEFNDESKLKILEFSQIFLKSRSTGLTGTDSATIEVVKGDAELSWEPIVNNQTEIFIVMGGTVSKPEVKTGQVAELRTGLTTAGNSVISVYQGNSAVSAAGGEVNVKQGMGVAVKPGQAPPAPQPLLKAPKISVGVKNIYTYTNPVLNWSKVDGAAQYLVEICADETCQQVLKQQAVDNNQWQINDFNQAGQFHFRVGAVSEDEIVGYRTAAQSLEFTGASDDVAPPLLAIDISGKRNQQEGQLVVGPKAQITLYAYDELAGLSTLAYRWDSGEWQTYQGQAINLPAADASLQVQATDHLGMSAMATYEFLTQ
ncbi:LysM peptidoglycan-binding domain-containing protein [Marinicella litoralis]|uniref:LysM domain-containing protein n=1 Tax=Marinicella litoralis TaxID=644220 RepID=A0A4R6XQD2_9GAMM|nr:LysM peptidoglycan-binding domain-containing protein [Marinicella litoralis]TDR19563.1 LysM domain-containing protein [Marinicella litoralis]